MLARVTTIVSSLLLGSVIISLIFGFTKLYPYLTENFTSSENVLGIMFLYVVVVATILMLSIDPIAEVSSKVRPVTWKISLPSETNNARFNSRRRVYLIVLKNPKVRAFLDILAKYYEVYMYLGNTIVDNTEVQKNN